MNQDHDFIIEDDVPLPTSPAYYPVEALNPNQSFVVKFKIENPTKPQREAIRHGIYKAIKRATAHWEAKGQTVSYTTRAVDDGIRIWRTA